MPTLPYKNYVGKVPLACNIAKLQIGKRQMAIYIGSLLSVKIVAYFNNYDSFGKMGNLTVFLEFSE